MNSEFIPLDERTYRIENGFVRAFLLLGSERALLIDSGATTPDLRAEAEARTSLPLSLLNTHADGDHTSGNGAFPEFWMHPADARLAAEKFPDAHILPLCTGQVIDLGDRPLEILAIPGHTRGCVAVLDRNARVLYSGDSVQDGHVYMFGPHRDPEAFGPSLLRLAARMADFDVIRPSHGTPELPEVQVLTVLREWTRVRKGLLSPRTELLHGAEVFSYDGDGCGFYCDGRAVQKKS